MMKNRVICLCFFSALLCACSVTDVGLFIMNGLAKTGSYTVTRSVSYGSHSDNRLDIYHPSDNSVLQIGDKASTKAPVVIFFYGGCWGACSELSKNSYEFVAEALSVKGYMVVIADYRRYPDVRFPAIIDDARAAVEWVKNNIDQHGGQSSQLFLMGHSAGAHMAAMLTLNEQYLSTQTYHQIKGFIGLAGPYDFLPLTKEYQKVVFGPEENYPASQPINFINGTEPPLKLLYGLNDTVVRDRNIKNLSSKVKEKGGKVETTYYENIDHVEILTAMSIVLRGRSSVVDDIVDFLNRHSS